MRLLACLAVVAGLLWAPAAHADTTGPPFDYSVGAADRFTGSILAVSAHSGARAAGLPAGAEVTGLVGIQRPSPPGRIRAAAVVNVGQLVLADPDAMLCIQIGGAGLPNSQEGGGPVCQRVSDPVYAMRLESFVFLETYAESRAFRFVTADVFLAAVAVPPENGATAQAAQVVEIRFDPAS